MSKLMDATFTVSPGQKHAVNLGLSNPGRRAVRVRIFVECEEGSEVQIIGAPYEVCKGQITMLPVTSEGLAGLKGLGGVRRLGGKP